MKAIFNNQLYVCADGSDTLPDCITLEAMDSSEIINVELSDPNLIIDPTDDEISWAEYTRKLPKYNDLNPSPEPTALGAEKFGRIFEMAQQMQKEDAEAWAEHEEAWADEEREEDRQNFNEALADIAFNCGSARETGKLITTDSRHIIAEIIRWAEEFHRIHAKQDWIDLDYIETVDDFAAEKIEGYKAPKA